MSKIRVRRAALIMGACTALLSACQESSTPAAPAAPPQPIAGPSSPAPAAAPAQAPATPPADQDAALRTKVRAALAGDPRTGHGGIDVEVRQGVVRLWGTVQSADALRAAEQHARAVPGVRAVESKLVVIAGS